MPAKEETIKVKIAAGDAYETWIAEVLRNAGIAEG